MTTKLETLLGRPTVDDLVAGVLAKAKVEQIHCGSVAMHSFFHDLSQEESLPEDIERIFTRVSFSQGDWCPFSKQIEGALMRLQIGRLLSAMNPDFRAYTMSPEQRGLVEKRLSHFDREDQAFLEKAGTRFRELLQQEEDSKAACGC